MRIQWTLLLAAGLIAPAPAVALAQPLRRPPLVVGNVSGNLHIFQSTPAPCPSVDDDVAVSGGHFEIAPAAVLDLEGGRQGFLMTQGTITFQPFTTGLSCAGHEETHRYTALSVDVANAVPFVGVPSDRGILTFSISPRDVILHETATRNGVPERRTARPRDPVSGTIDLVHRRIGLTVRQ